jgi:G3E family GTPase
MNASSLVVIGGFLGAGKTTLATNLVNYLWLQEKEVALVTNDQSVGLVDTEIAKAGGISVTEIAGGCFCCRCHEFALALDEIAALRSVDIIVAEAVGSCTDLVATVVEPLRVDLQRPYEVLPMTIVVDPMRAEAVLLGRESEIGAALHDDVKYIFLKQLEEAQVILLNKSDTIPAARMEEICQATRARFPEAKVLPFSAQNFIDLRDLWHYLETTKPVHRPIQEIDYERYARGEAYLGWLNAECEFTAAHDGVPMDRLSDSIGAEIHRRLASSSLELAHLKVSVANAHPKNEPADEPMNDEKKPLSVVQSVSTAAPPIPVRRSSHNVTHARALINLRAQASATILESEVRAAVDLVSESLRLAAKIVRLDSFAPAAPNPPYQRR